MTSDLVLRKTAKGREEIDKRLHHIDSRRRTLLILVDGRASVDEVAKRAAHIEDAAALLQQLHAEGFVEPVDGSRPLAPTANSDAAASSDSLATVKRRACREIERLMGPGGEPIALELERAATHQEFLEAARKARDAIGAILGPRKAAQFWQALEI